MTTTILRITEEVWGFSKTWWFVDATNEPSKKVAKACGFQLHSSYEQLDKSSPDKASGLYLRLVKNRPEGLAPGILQGADHEYWSASKNASFLEAVIRARKQNQDD
jgi:hypothetical protein